MDYGLRTTGYGLWTRTGHKTLTKHYGLGIKYGLGYKTRTEHYGLGIKTQRKVQNTDFLTSDHGALKGHYHDVAHART